MALASASMAGGLSDPVVTPEVVMADAVEVAQSSSSAVSVVLLMTVLVLGVAAASGGGSGGMVLASDERLKTDIAPTGRTTVHGLPLYQFSYTGIEGHVYEGVMAQDVLKVQPDAVIKGDTGILAVDYAALGIEMKVIR
ncbi:tail fiber domain-containing protein [Pseudaestuariivita sp.]|uniref:tail fiber domain-containing protein n=1 Tax=Pseudaestuariivita sp. TaxID=2211669 RepID=UPI004059ADF3